MATLSTPRIHEYHWSEWVAACEEKRRKPSRLAKIEISNMIRLDPTDAQTFRSLSTPGLDSCLLATSSSHVPTPVLQ